MKWSKIGSQTYQAVSVTGRVYVVRKASIYLWRLTIDDGTEMKSHRLKHLKAQAETMDVEHQKRLLN